MKQNILSALGVVISFIGGFLLLGAAYLIFYNPAQDPYREGLGFAGIPLVIVGFILTRVLLKRFFPNLVGVYKTSGLYGGQMRLVLSLVIVAICAVIIDVVFGNSEGKIGAYVFLISLLPIYYVLRLWLSQRRVEP